MFASLVLLILLDERNLSENVVLSTIRHNKSSNHKNGDRLINKSALKWEKEELENEYFDKRIYMGFKYRNYPKWVLRYHLALNSLTSKWQYYLSRKEVWIKKGYYYD